MPVRTSLPPSSYLLHDLLWVLVVNCAAHALCCAQHLLAGACQVLGTAAGAHHTSDLDDVVHGDVAAVLDVLLLRGEVCGFREGGGMQVQWVVVRWGGGGCRYSGWW
jgi:hypothetical protein